MSPSVPMAFRAFQPPGHACLNAVALNGMAFNPALTRVLRHWSTVGAVAPSSRALSDAMARHANGAEMLVELGAGTGPITQALVERYPGTPLVCVELQPELASRLAKRFPSACIEARPAAQVLKELRSREATPAATVVVSALPFRSLPRAIHDETVEALVKFLLQAPVSQLAGSRRLVQFTYQPRPPFDVSAWPELRWTRVESVWRNAPPAGVWSLAPSLGSGAGLRP